MGKICVIYPIDEVLVSLIYKGQKVKKEKTTREYENTWTTSPQKQEPYSRCRTVAELQQQRNPGELDIYVHLPDWQRLNYPCYFFGEHVNNRHILLCDTTFFGEKLTVSIKMLNTHTLWLGNSTYRNLSLRTAQHLPRGLFSLHMCLIISLAEFFNRKKLKISKYSSERGQINKLYYCHTGNENEMRWFSPALTCPQVQHNFKSQNRICMHTFLFK